MFVVAKIRQEDEGSFRPKISSVCEREEKEKMKKRRQAVMIFFFDVAVILLRLWVSFFFFLLAVETPEFLSYLFSQFLISYFDCNIFLSSLQYILGRDTRYESVVNERQEDSSLCRECSLGRLTKAVSSAFLLTWNMILWWSVTSGGNLLQSPLSQLWKSKANNL